MSDSDEAQLGAQVFTEQMRRRVATRELAELGIVKVSPADIEAWLRYTPRQRRDVSMNWLVWNASYN